MERIVLMPIDGSTPEAAAARLQTFDVKRTRCYDPNEERRLKDVIMALGDERFNSRIHALGGKLGGKLGGSASTTGSKFTSRLKLWSRPGSRSSQLVSGAISGGAEGTTRGSSCKPDGADADKAAMELWGRRESPDLDEDEAVGAVLNVTIV